ncbi:histone-like nucleoid-structuring protein Lsr2 [Variovorax sp. PBS-H4]|uniref:histone-like nucleoid-structuring protein Lsr2 n=1 Tax=Variovorax sp. PBS-H4 TaxID=434008 RepID=UPI0013A571AC|nr:Lsr2 family protein [Variovorax sp. PBS-H4]
MATHTSVQLIDDLDGKSEAAETVQFGLDGAVYEIDLTQANADKLRKALDRYVDAARQLKHTPDRGTRRRSAGRTRSREDMAQIRSWAAENGYEVADRGRLPQTVLDAYDAH